MVCGLESPLNPQTGMSALRRRVTLRASRCARAMRAGGFILDTIPALTTLSGTQPMRNATAPLGVDDVNRHRFGPP